VQIGERADALFDVVDATTVTPNTFDIIAGVADMSIAFKLRVNGAINAVSFGLSATNSAADNSSALQAAIDAASVVAQTTSVTTVDIVTAWVRVPAGVYASEGFTLKNGVGIVGDGMSSTVFVHSGTNPAITTDKTTFKYGVQLRDFAVIGNATAGVHGLDGWGLIRSCKASNLLIERFDINYNLSNCWTFRLEDCQGQNPLTHNIKWDGATNAAIIRGRYDAAGSDNIYILNQTIDTEGLVIQDVAAQASQGAGILIEGINSVEIRGGFIEANKQDGLTDKAYIHADMDGTGILVISGHCYVNQGGSGGAGRGAVFADNVKTVLISGIKVQGGANLINGIEIGGSVEAFTIDEARLAVTNPIIDNSASGTIKNVKYNNKIQEISNVEIAVGEGYYKAGAKRVTRRASSSNLNSLPTDRQVEINTDSGGRFYTLQSVDIAEDGRQIRVVNMGSNTLTVQTQGSELINGAATYVIPAGVGNSVLLTCTGSSVIAT
jgi:hypothetical protein